MINDDTYTIHFNITLGTITKHQHPRQLILGLCLQQLHMRANNKLQQSFLEQFNLASLILLVSGCQKNRLSTSSHLTFYHCFHCLLPYIRKIRKFQVYKSSSTISSARNLATPETKVQPQSAASPHTNKEQTNET